MKSPIINGLMLGLLVLAANFGVRRLPDREPARDAQAVVRFTPVRLDQQGFAPLRLAGAWAVTSTEPRMGGVSALAIDRGGLLALSDSGVTIRLPKPIAASGKAEFRDLPAGPGGAHFKAGRDSEALARDAGGRGWWVAFENLHSAWLFDPDFRHSIRTIDLRAMRWRANLGAEGALSTNNGLLLFPESGDEIVKLKDGVVERRKLSSSFGRLSDATMLPDGTIVLIARNYSLAGFSARLVVLKDGALRRLARLALGRLDNAEAIAAEPLAGGGTRLWVMTDNDFRRRVPTLLVALDWRG